MPTTETKTKATPKTKAKKAAAAPAPIIPVSAEANIEVTIFETPQNGMRGMAIASDTVNGKWVRLGHAFLWADRPAELTLDATRGKKSAADLLRVIEILSLFAKTLEETDAAR